MCVGHSADAVSLWLAACDSECLWVCWQSQTLHCQCSGLVSALYGLYHCGTNEDSFQITVRYCTLQSLLTAVCHSPQSELVPSLLTESESSQILCFCWLLSADSAWLIKSSFILRWLTYSLLRYQRTVRIRIHTRKGTTRHRVKSVDWIVHTLRKILVTNNESLHKKYPKYQVDMEKRDELTYTNEPFRPSVLYRSPGAQRPQQTRA